MYMRQLAALLLATTSLSTFAQAQTADPAVKDPAAAAATATPDAPAATSAAPAAETPAAKPATTTAAPPAASSAAPATAAPAKAATTAQPAPTIVSKPAATTPAATTYTPVTPSKPKAAAAAPTDAGVVYAKQPEAPKANVAITQPGLTSAPTDAPEAVKKSSNAGSTAAAAGPGSAQGTAATGSAQGVAGSAGATPGGVTGQDLGGGNMVREVAKKTRSTVTRDAIDKQSPTANPYQVINLLPGVVQSSTDNTGANGGNIRMRGFNSDHIGLTIEGMPVNDSGNYALFPQEYTDSENISQVSIAQGTPDLDSPHVGSTGGVINIYARDPQEDFGALVDVSLGSDNLKRIFTRVDTGQVGPARAFLSYSYLTKEHWGDNPGEDERRHLDFKTVYNLGDGNTVRFTALYNDAVNNFYPNPTMAQFNAGTGFQYLPSLPSSFFKQTSPIDQSANNAFNFIDYRVNPFRNLILSAPSNFKITENLKFDTIPYYWYGFGNGGGTATMSESGMFWGNLKVTNVNYGGTGALTDKILYYNPSITETNRPGVIDKFTYTMGDHKVVAGHWFELAQHRQYAPYVALNADGTVQDPFAEHFNFSLPSTAKCNLFDPSKPVAQQVGAQVVCPTGNMQRRDQYTTTMSNAVFIGDSWKISKDLTIDAGVKQVWIDREVKNRMPGSNPAINSLHDTATLPTVGVSYSLNDDNRVFANYGTSFRSAPNFTLIQSFSNSNGGIAPVNEIPTERGQTFEVGHRYQGHLLATSVSAFYGQYKNYQVSTSVRDITGGTGNQTITINAGDLENYGINAEIGFAPINYFRPYLSGEWLHTELLDNVIQGATSVPVVAGVANPNYNDTLRTKGKELPGAPSYSFGIGLDYDDGHFFGNLSYKYLGAQYSTFMNDQKMDAFGRLDASVGYRFSDFGSFKKPEIKLSMFNVLDARQLTGVNSITNNAVATTGLNGNTINASQPNYFLGQDFSFVVTMRGAF